MIAVDTNVLIYAHREESEWHETAVRRITELAEGSAPWLIPWPCVHEFLAATTNPRLFKPPTPLERAISQVDAWMESPTLTVRGEEDGHWPMLCDLLRSGKVIGGAVHDARIAAICREHGVRVLWTADRDFSRFAGLRAENPLVQG